MDGRDGDANTTSTRGATGANEILSTIGSTSISTPSSNATGIRTISGTNSVTNDGDGGLYDGINSISTRTRSSSTKTPIRRTSKEAVIMASSDITMDGRGINESGFSNGRGSNRMADADVDATRTRTGEGVK